MCSMRAYGKAQSVYRKALSKTQEAAARRSIEQQMQVCESKLREMARNHERVTDSGLIFNCKLKLFACRFCPFTANREGGLQRHQRVHARSKPHAFQCRFCSYSGITNNIIERHETLHTAARAQSVDVKSHNAPKAPKVEKAVKSECAKSADTARIRTKSYQCQYCPYKAIAASVISGHEKIHTRGIQSSQFVFPIHTRAVSETPHKNRCRSCSYSGTVSLLSCADLL